MGQMSRHLPDSSLVLGQTNTNNRALLRKILAPPQTDTEERNSHLAMLNSLQHHCKLASMSEQLLNHFLLTLSLERVSLPSPTSLPNFSSPPPPLLFDFPLNIPLKDTVSGSGALVPYSGAGSAGTKDSVEYELNLPPAQHPSLVEFSVCEPMSPESLLQHLQTLSSTHPYLSVFTHKLSQSTIAVASSGFDGRPLHSYSWESLAHSRVAFNNYLQYVAQRCGGEVDRAVEEDTERREKFEEEQRKLIEAREKELEQGSPEKQHKEEEAEVAKGSAKGGKKSSASSTKRTPNGKRSKADVTCPTPEPDKAHDTTEAELPEFEERKLYEAYDVGDRVLLKRGTVSVQFLGDGSQIHTDSIDNLGQERTITVSALSNGHSVTCTTTRGDPNSNSKSDERRKNENEGADGTTTDGEEAQLPTASGVTAGIPQPPPGVKFSSINAQFRDSLCVSLSHFGPRGDGELPFQPEKPEILLEAVPTESAASESRPQSRQTPQKVSKKQLEQQQLLEQQRQLEEQKERAEAQANFDARCSALLRQNKYQQLFATTHYGLHVHLQIDIDLDADPEITDGSDGRIVVRQSYPSQGSRHNIPSLSLATCDEEERYCLPDGSVLCFMRDGSVTVLCPDGHVYQTATQSLTDLYHQQTVSDSTSGGTDSPSKEENGQNAQQTFSDTKVTFADQMREGDQQSKVGPGERRKLSQCVWVVTTPSGQRYLWRCPAPTTKQTEDSGESEVLAPGAGAAAVDEVTTDTAPPQQQEQQQGERIVCLPPAQLLSATDPVTKEVNGYARLKIGVSWVLSTGRIRASLALEI